MKANLNALSAITLNMQSGQIWDPLRPDEAPFDVDRTIEFLKEQDSDLIFLQEVELPREGKSGAPDDHPNYDRLRAGLTGWHSWFAWPAASRPQLPFGVGLAIFSRYPLQDCFHLVLPTADVRFEFRGQTWLPAERSLIGASILVDGCPLQLLNTHLQAWFMIDTTADAHPEQRRVLATVLRGRKTPVILAGDFNCTAEEGTVAEIEACGLATVQKRKFTWHRQPLVLDHIFYSPELRPLSHAVLTTTVSDHDAVQANFTLS